MLGKDCFLLTHWELPGSAHATAGSKPATGSGNFKGTKSTGGMLLAWTASERKILVEALGGQCCGFTLCSKSTTHLLHRSGEGSAGSLVTSALFCWPDCWKSLGKEKHDLAVMPWIQNTWVVPLSVSVRRDNYSDLCQGTSSFQDRVPNFLLLRGWNLCVSP